jgi:hypothetical protein
VTRPCRLPFAMLAFAALILTSAPARAGDAETAAPPPPKTFRPMVLGDVRGMFLIRSNDNYFQHTDTFRYGMPQVAGGIGLTAGVEIVPRLALLASAHYVVNGSDRGDAHLRLVSGAVLGLVRWSFVRIGDTDAESKGFFDTSLTGGFGRYVIRETYYDTSLSPDSFHKDDGSFGGQIGTEASVTAFGFRASIGYAFHYAPATVNDRIGGAVYAGGHELSLGLGVRL